MIPGYLSRALTLLKVALCEEMMTNARLRAVWNSGGGDLPHPGLLSIFPSFCVIHRVVRDRKKIV